MNSAYRPYWPYGVPMRRRRVVPKSTAAPAAVPVDVTLEKRKFRRPLRFLSDTPELVRKVVLPIVNDLQRGKANNTYEVTLAVAPATQTSVTAEMSTPASEAVLTPKSATAAAALGLVWTECLLGSVVIHHDSNIATDRTFGVVIHG